MDSLIKRLQEAESGSRENGPFGTVLCGGSQRTEMRPAANCSDATIALGKAAARRPCSSAQVISSSCETLMDQPSLLGECPAIAATDKQASSARYSATKARASRRSLSDKLTQSLITSGLVCGITPSSIRTLSGQPIRVLAFDMQAGDGRVSQPWDSSSLNAGETA